MGSKKLILPFLIIFFVFIIGTIGYILLGWSLIDAVYMTVITVSSVGFGEIKPLSTSGRIFTIFLIIFGLSAVGFTFSQVVEYFIEITFSETYQTKKREKKIKMMKEHYIICGYGRMGKQIVKEFLAKNVEMVIIETNPAEKENLEESKVKFLIGDTSSEELLIKAGIHSAKGVICVTGSDAVNVFITLTAKALNPNAFIVSRATYEDVESRLKKAGADVVFSPYIVGARRMAASVLKPNAVEFLDLVMQSKNMELLLEEITVKKNSKLYNKSLKESDIRKKTGVLVLCIKKSNSELLTNPPSSAVICENDVLIVLGTPEQLQQMLAVYN